MVHPKTKRSHTTPLKPILEASYRARFKRIPLGGKRLAAWGLEVALLAISSLAPFHLGLIVNTQTVEQSVPLNPALSRTQDVIARTFFLPKRTLHKTVAPLTNLLWSIALAAPILLTGSQLYWLGKTGETLPKRWLRLQVVTSTGTPPGFVNAVRRELLGRWGIPLGVAYVVWVWSGAFPGLGILSALAILSLLAEGLTAQLHRSRRAWHDCLATTYVIDCQTRYDPGQDAVTVDWYPYTHGESSFLDKGLGESAEYALTWTEEAGGLTSVVLTPQSMGQPRQLRTWRSRRFGFTLGIVSLIGLIGLVGALVMLPRYQPQPINWRQRGDKNDQVFLTLVEMLTATADPQAMGASHSHLGSGQ